MVVKDGKVDFVILQPMKSSLSKKGIHSEKELCAMTQITTTEETESWWEGREGSHCEKSKRGVWDVALRQIRHFFQE